MLPKLVSVFLEIISCSFPYSVVNILEFFCYWKKCSVTDLYSYGLGLQVEGVKNWAACVLVTSSSKVYGTAIPEDTIHTKSFVLGCQSHCEWNPPKWQYSLKPYCYCFQQMSDVHFFCCFIIHPKTESWEEVNGDGCDESSWFKSVVLKQERFNPDVG